MARIKSLLHFDVEPDEEDHRIVAAMKLE
jgi:hypothetical protein